MDPMYLPSVENDDAPGPYGEAIRGMKAQGAPVPQIRYLFAFKPHTKFLGLFTQEVMRGPSPLSPGLRELIAAFTSRRNDCPFWIGSHAAVAAELLGDRALVDAVLDDFEHAPIDDAHRALFRLVDQICADSTQIDQAAIDAAKATGWGDEALYDAITVCALFQFYNTWIDATGVHDLPAAAYMAMGPRMAKGGYAGPDDA